MRTRQKLESEIKDRELYLKSIEVQIEEISANGNNRLFELHGQIDKAENELASVLKKKYEIEQIIRERQHIVDNQ